jgi:hypothetical protein
LNKIVSKQFLTICAFYSKIWWFFTFALVNRFFFRCLEGFLKFWKDFLIVKIDDLMLKIDDLKVKTHDLMFRIDDLKIKTDDLMLQIHDLMLQTDDFNLQTVNLMLKIDDFNLQIDDLMFRFVQIKPRTHSLKPRPAVLKLDSMRLLKTTEIITIT